MDGVLLANGTTTASDSFPWALVIAIAAAGLGVVATAVIGLSRKRLADADQARARAERQLVFDTFYRQAAESDALKLSELFAVMSTKRVEVESPETKQVIADLKERLSAIEERFPARSTVDKLESVNDAILATKIEALERELERLSDAAITKWTVATIAFSVLGGLGILIGIIGGAVTLFA